MKVARIGRADVCGVRQPCTGNQGGLWMGKPGIRVKERDSMPHCGQNPAQERFLYRTNNYSGSLALGVYIGHCRVDILSYQDLCSHPIFCTHVQVTCIDHR